MGRRSSTRRTTPSRMPAGSASGPKPTRSFSSTTSLSKAIKKPFRAVGFWEAFRYWVKLGFISFGGPAGQIAIMQRDLVDRKRWISQERFLHALSFCMLLPGPEAQQLAIYI